MNEAFIIVADQAMLEASGSNGSRFTVENAANAPGVVLQGWTLHMNNFNKRDFNLKSSMNVLISSILRERAYPKGSAIDPTGYNANGHCVKRSYNCTRSITKYPHVAGAKVETTAITREDNTIHGMRKDVLRARILFRASHVPAVGVETVLIRDSRTPWGRLWRSRKNSSSCKQIR